MPGHRGRRRRFEDGTTYRAPDGRLFRSFREYQEYEMLQPRTSMDAATGGSGRGGGDSGTTVPSHDPPVVRRRDEIQMFYVNEYVGSLPRQFRNRENFITQLCQLWASYLGVNIEGFNGDAPLANREVEFITMYNEMRVVLDPPTAENWGNFQTAIDAVVVHRPPHPPPPPVVREFM